ncbi:hypothetical protein IEQ34_006804 [Dendrobium chrysotoxum]|uniref:Uncharacterized protein n=1 Tax=Dendrobium chrysotoxum TaxID=161865 RepID=A0AAV7H8Z0_DENCH|nr:hypothetical protein IEQ34_006804 [Dendrobium chrysotoxum]
MQDLQNNLKLSRSVERICTSATIPTSSLLSLALARDQVRNLSAAVACDFPLLQHLTCDSTPSIKHNLPQLDPDSASAFSHDQTCDPPATAYPNLTPTDSSLALSLPLLSRYPTASTGSIPLTFSHCRNVIDLELDNNQISNTIPSELSRLDNIQTLYLWKNRLERGIPQELAGCMNLEAVDLSHNATVPRFQPPLTSRPQP